MHSQATSRLVAEHMPGLGQHAHRYDPAFLIVACERSFAVSAEQAWRALTDDAAAPQWIGPRSTNNSTGRVDVLLTQENPSPWLTFTIKDAQPGRSITLALEATKGDRVSPRHITFTLDSDPRAVVPGCTITVMQSYTCAQTLEQRGPLWEFYLDRLACVIEGGDSSQVRLHPYYLPGLVPHYRGILRQAIRNGGDRIKNRDLP
ncbi:hypothetical protein [Dermatophilus congolensis]|uniref:Activator of Hsp90 ATPase homolog 1-like protein n=1 Tax=Dermatophilus congolensis TaxID=1863 RepID=A0A239VKT3_9MICO|nr:hypothetical protein [Dermatophilus congolensis]MBO3129396.1 hypothetical protein [Dermatophilus congolensis]MBO3131971.1 hypothetical protein [Dermatophilus congolensis]MBO3133873.1 hypothetical protein [Dermatophilus congolensis]MBO3136103.1 hypothetical protein [Dermatophilus congolensis]MBO3138347.1 hypothetical protein [Dermatophilus congolensis]